jgi:hypothetical protein
MLRMYIRRSHASASELSLAALTRLVTLRFATGFLGRLTPTDQ